MAVTDVGQSVISDMSNRVDDYSVDTQETDGVMDQKETYWVNDRWGQQLAYWKTKPELNRAITSLAIWTAGKGFTTNTATEALLDGITGWGEDTFTSIMINMLKVKKIGGDAYAEIIRNPKTGTWINLKPLDPGSMRIVVNPKGIIIRYEQISKIKDKEPVKFNPRDILHLCNDRIADEIHGTSIADLCEEVILARNEMMADRRKVLHRNVVPFRIIEVDSDNTVKLAKLKKDYEDAINKGEVIIVPKGNVGVKDSNPVIIDSLQDIRYLENVFYQSVGVPRVIATSEEYTESGAKVGFLTFEPVYTNEQTQLEGDLLNQLAIRIKFNRPPSLGGALQRDEAKDTGQMGFQPNDTEAGVGE